MDLSFVKKKLADNANKGAKREKVDYSKIFWKPKVGTHRIRIVPNKFCKEWPLREIQMHYGFSKGPIVALTNWGEADPIVDFVQKLRKSSDKEDWTLAGKMSPKTRYFAPVLVRGEEDKGIRLWEVGKLVNDQLLGIASDEDYGDFTDITDGRDFSVDAVEDTVANKKVVKCTLRPKPKATPILDDAAALEKALDEQPDILAINRKYNYDALKEILQKWLTPDEVTEEHKEEEEEEATAETEAPFHTSEVKGKTTPTNKFDALFPTE